MSPRETEAKWESRSALPYDGGEDSKGVTPPIGWLEDYWMGRYYGFIAAPKTEDPELISIKPRDEKRHGAAPYEGPGRPIEVWEKKPGEK